MTVAAAICAAAAVAVGWLLPGPGVARLRTVLQPVCSLPSEAWRPAELVGRGAGSAAGAGSVPDSAGSTARAGPLSGVAGRTVACLLVVVATAALVGGAGGVLVGAVAGNGAWRALARLKPRAWAQDRDRVVAMTPLAANLVSAALTAGCPPVTAVHAVGAAVGGPLGQALLDAAAAARVGADPESAWANVTAEPAARPLAKALVAAMTWGTSPVPVLDRIAVDAREAARWAAQTRARSLGARAAAPLGLCFLPAFVLLGVVPVVATSGIVS